MAKPNVVVLTNFPVHYRVPIFNALARDSSIEFSVVYCAASEAGREWVTPSNIEHTWRGVNASPLQVGSRTLYASPSILRLLASLKPDVLVTGGFSLPTAYCIGYKLVRPSRVGLVFFGEATRHSERHIGGWKTLLRRAQVRYADAFVAACKDARDYFQDLGAHPSAVWESLLTTDVSAYEHPRIGYQEWLQDTRSRLGIRGKVILYCGRLTQQKGVVLLLEAFESVLKRCPDAYLVLVGSGDQEAKLRATAQTLGLRNVHFAGFMQQGDLPVWYHLADLFVFPTLCDRFGVVVVEAIAAGLPVVCSKYAGAARDLVFDGQNGFVVDPADVAAMAGRILAILQNNSLSKEMTSYAKNVLERCRVEVAAKEFLGAIEFAAARRGIPRSHAA